MKSYKVLRAIYSYLNPSDLNAIYSKYFTVDGKTHNYITVGDTQFYVFKRYYTYALVSSKDESGTWQEGLVSDYKNDSFTPPTDTHPYTSTAGTNARSNFTVYYNGFRETIRALSDLITPDTIEFTSAREMIAQLDSGHVIKVVIGDNKGSIWIYIYNSDGEQVKIDSTHDYIRTGVRLIVRPDEQSRLYNIVNNITNGSTSAENRKSSTTRSVVKNVIARLQNTKKEYPTLDIDMISDNIYRISDTENPYINVELNANKNTMSFSNHNLSMIMNDDTDYDVWKSIVNHINDMNAKYSKIKKSDNIYSTLSDALELINNDKSGTDKIRESMKLLKNSPIYGTFKYNFDNILDSSGVLDTLRETPKFKDRYDESKPRLIKTIQGVLDRLEGYMNTNYKN